MPRMQIWSTVQPPAVIPQSYRPFGFAKYGLCCWVYNGYDGVIEWINSQFFVTDSKLPGVTGFRYYANAGVQMLLTPTTIPLPPIPDVAINAVLTNAALGKNMPLPPVP